MRDNFVVNLVDKKGNINFKSQISVNCCKMYMKKIQKIIQFKKIFFQVVIIGLGIKDGLFSQINVYITLNFQM